jgi:AraC-like DNA-binding protein
MVSLSGLSERSFARRFAKATGMPPLEYILTMWLTEKGAVTKRNHSHLLPTPFNRVLLEKQT